MIPGTLELSSGILLTNTLSRLQGKANDGTAVTIAWVGGSGVVNIANGSRVNIEVGANDFLVNDDTQSGTQKNIIFRDVSAGALYLGGGDATVTLRTNLVSNGFQIQASRNNAPPVVVNRTGNDGPLIRLQNDGIDAGNISVSGTTVSYNGGHLSRWSQLEGLGERIEIPRGTLMSSVDEMCEWWVDAYEDEEDGVTKYRLFNPNTGTARGVVTKENNEQLVRCKVSDTPGGVRILGIMECWDDEPLDEHDDPWDYDLILAAVGDFPVRVTGPVNGGDYLESAGDGTARRQAEQVFGPNTIAKAAMGFPDAAEDEENLVPAQLLIG